jgi:hypothetical protein
MADVTVACGAPVTLQCVVAASPTPAILWRKDGRMIGNTRDFQQTFENNVAKMIIGEIYPQDGGCYECVASNAQGEAVIGCQLTVAGKG